jgi:RNA polymerase II subunit A small phosphatase-like protein
MFHPQNAVGCTSFIDRRDDDEFDVIFPFLEKLSKVENVEEHTQPWVAILDHLEEEAERRHNSS